MQDRKLGGGRIIGEVCHFVDLLTFLTGSMPCYVHATKQSDPKNLGDTISINLEFSNGSLGTIIYCANGPSNLPKERIEVFQSSQSWELDDFHKLIYHNGSGKAIETRSRVQNKGQKEMLKAFFESIEKNNSMPIPFKEILAVSASCIAVERAAQNRSVVRIKAGFDVF